MKQSLQLLKSILTYNDVKIKPLSEYGKRKLVNEAFDGKLSEHMNSITPTSLNELTHN